VCVHGCAYPAGPVGYGRCKWLRESGGRERDRETERECAGLCLSSWAGRRTSGVKGSRWTRTTKSTTGCSLSHSPPPSLPSSLSPPPSLSSHSLLPFSSSRTTLDLSFSPSFWHTCPHCQSSFFPLPPSLDFSLIPSLIPFLIPLSSLPHFPSLVLSRSAVASPSIIDRMISCFLSLSLALTRAPRSGRL
jgi:hypothetical protein